MGALPVSEECGSTLVTLRRWRNLRCQKLTRTRDQVSSDRRLIPAPLSSFRISNTLHHRLRAVARSDAASSQQENKRYVLRSCSRYILLGYSLIDTKKNAQNRRSEAFAAYSSPENRLKFANLPVLEPFFRCLSGYRPIEYCGRSYELCSACNHRISVKSQGAANANSGTLLVQSSAMCVII